MKKAGNSFWHFRSDILKPSIGYSFTMWRAFVRDFYSIYFQSLTYTHAHIHKWEMRRAKKGPNTNTIPNYYFFQLCCCRGSSHLFLIFSTFIALVFHLSFFPYSLVHFGALYFSSTLHSSSECIVDATTYYIYDAFNSV